MHLIFPRKKIEPLNEPEDSAVDSATGEMWAAALPPRSQVKDIFEIAGRALDVPGNLGVIIAC